MTSNARKVGFSSVLVFSVVPLSLALAVSCSQAPPAFVERPVDEVELGRSGSEADASAAMKACLKLAPNHPECVAAASGAESDSSGSGVGSVDASNSVFTGSESNPIGTPDPVVVVNNPTPTPSSGPVVVTNPTPSPTPAPTPTPTPAPRAGILHQQVVQEPRQGKVDILWVIDNSGSMDWAQQALAAKFESFANQLVSANIDFRLGVTTTDMCRPDRTVDEFCPVSNTVSSSGLQGNLVSVPNSSQKFLSSTSGSVVNSFRTMALRGTSGSSLEQGLSAAKYAVQKSATGGTNAGFIRSDARLSVVVLSDEEDDGVGMWGRDGYGNAFNDFFGNPNYALDATLTPKFNFANQHMTAERFVQDLGALKGAGTFQLNAITGVKNAQNQTHCYLDANGNPFGPMESGTNYIKAASLTGGVVQNICGDWTNILTDIGRSTVELTTRIQLETKPFPGTLEVYVGGTLWASGYEYDAASNTVVFKTLPPYGAEVVVRYYDIVQ